MDRIRVAITTIASSYSIDTRVLLGIMIQESHGHVGVVTTLDADGVPTGGLMQASGCHGYDGQQNLAQVTKDNILSIQLRLALLLLRVFGLVMNLRTQFADKHVIDHRLTSPT